MRTPRAWVAGLLAISVGMVPMLATSPVAGAEAPGGSAVHAAAAKAAAAPPDIEYDNALSVDWVPSSVAGGSGSLPLPLRAVAHESLQYASAVPLRDARLQFVVNGPITMLTPASVRIRNVGAVDPTRYTAAFRIAGNGSGGIEAKLSGYAPGGGFLRYSAVLNFATGAGHVAFADNGLLAAKANALALESRSLGTARYSQELAALLGSGARTTFSEAAGPSASTTTQVSGTIAYLASDSSQHPSRSITVQVWDSDGTSPAGTLVASTTTNLSGQYSASVSTLRSDGTPRDLYVQALAANSGFTVVLNFGDTLPQHIDSTPETATGAPQTVALLANNTASNNTAFDIADMLVTGDQYVLRINNNTPFPRITVSYPNPKGTNFTPGQNIAKILQGDTFDWDVVLHEFGHYVASNLGIDTSKGGLHGWEDNLGQIYGKNAGIQLAWSEGFATWFSLTAQIVEGVAALKIPNAGDDYFDDTDDANFHVPMNTNTPYASKGEDNELSVARSLWHMRTDSDLAMSDLVIINALVAQHANTLSAAIAALLPAGGAAPFGNVDPNGDDSASSELKMNTFGCLETYEVVAPQIVDPAAHDVVGATPPTFTWQSNGAGPSNRLDQFQVQFWSPIWDKLLYQSAQITSAPTDNTVTYTPSQSEWNTFMATKDDNGKYPTAVNVVVVGSDTNTPTTGPYASCALPLSITPIDLTVAPADTFDNVIAPAPSLCPGYFDPQINQFVLNGTGLEPSTSYALELYDPKNGYGPVINMTPNSVTTNSIGDINSATITIPDMPAQKNWPLILTPQSGQQAITTVPIVWDLCAETLTTIGPTPLYWGGAGVAPNTTVTLYWDGAEIESVTSQPDGEYFYSGSTPPTVTCTGSDTITVDATTFNGASDISGALQCGSSAAGGDKAMARDGEWRSG